MKKTTTASATSVAALKAQTANEVQAHKFAQLSKVVNKPETLHALLRVSDVATMENAEGVTQTLHTALQHLTNTVQITLGRSYGKTEEERMQELQEHACDIVDELGEIVFLFGQIIDHYRAVDNLQNIIRKAI